QGDEQDMLDGEGVAVRRQGGVEGIGIGTEVQVSGAAVVGAQAGGGPGGRGGREQAAGQQGGDRGERGEAPGMSHLGIPPCPLLLSSTRRKYLGIVGAPLVGAPTMPSELGSVPRIQGVT